MLEILLGHLSPLEHYFWKIHQSIDINLITINKVIKATAMISKLISAFVSLTPASN
jgi:hypothetical protein